MKIDIYYFSGTGNSLWFAREIAEKIEGSNLLSIPKVISNQIEIEGDVIGIVSPIYMYNMPHLVVDFIRTIKKANYIFMVFSGGGSLGGGIKETFKLFKTQNLVLSALFNIPLPSNYTPYGVLSEEEQEKLFENAKNRMGKIINTVQAQASFVDGDNTSFFKTYIHPGILYKLGYSQIPVLDKSFIVSDTCNGCSICEKVCPVNNIEMKDNKPVWNHQCQHCYACLQWCPLQAIESGKRTMGTKRYHHPDVAVKDIIGSSPD